MSYVFCIWILYFVKPLIFEVQNGVIFESKMFPAPGLIRYRQVEYK